MEGYVMKVVLAALNAKYVHSNLAVYDIEAYVKEKWINDTGSCEGLDLVVKEYTINHNLDKIMQSLYEENADLLAFSCYIWNISEILNICKELKKVASKLSIWLGGPEVSYDSVKVLETNSFIDGIICGEGEATVYEIVKFYTEYGSENAENTDNVRNELTHEMSNSNELKTSYRNTDENRYMYMPREKRSKKEENIRGITYRANDGKIHQNAVRPLISMDEIPFIYKDLTRFENKILYYESSRGCPFSCSYCLSSIDKSVRFRNLTLVKNELSFFMDNRVRQVKFIDRTFNCDKKRAREIWKYLCNNDNGLTNYHFEIAADLIEDEDLKIFSRMRPGLIQLEIGLQSTNTDTINEIRRVMDIEKLRSNMLAVRKMGNIHQHLDLIAGLPFEDLQSFVRSFNDAYSMQPNQLQLGFLKVLKGSYMEEQVKEYQLLYRDEQPYEVLSTKWISYGEILKLKQVEEMVEVYYNSDQFEHVLPFVVSFFETPFEMFDELGRYYDEHGTDGAGYKRESRYEMLREFFREYIASIIDISSINIDTIQSNYNYDQNNVCEIDDKDCGSGIMGIFDSLLTFDYYLRENAKNRPSWSREYPIDKNIYNEFFKNGGTEEVSLIKDGYDSKVAARNMHIEPIDAEAVRWIYNDEEKTETSIENSIYGDVGVLSVDNVDVDADVFHTDNADENIELRYVLFDYSKRNPLSGDAAFTILSHL